MKRFLLAVVALTILVAFGSFTGPERKWLVTKESCLQISGSSNISEFQCLNLTYEGKDTLFQEWSAAHKTNVLSGMISLKAEGFDCQNKLITTDFRNTLDVQKHPEIKVQFLGLRIQEAAGQEPVKGQVEITIAGVSKRYEICSQFFTLENGKTQLTGRKVVRLSDFGLEPRSRMLGMVKVEDTVEVNFNLIIRPV